MKTKTKSKERESKRGSYLLEAGKQQTKRQVKRHYLNHTSKQLSFSSRSLFDLLIFNESLLLLLAEWLLFSFVLRALEAITPLGSKGSTTTTSVPLISARQNGQPWPSQSCEINNYTFRMPNHFAYEQRLMNLPARNLDKACRVSGRMVQCECPCRFRRKSCTTEK